MYSKNETHGLQLSLHYDFSLFRFKFFSVVKGTGGVITRYPPCQDSNEPLKPLSYQKCRRYRRFSASKSV